MVSTSHPNASELFARDLGGLVKFFAMKMRYVPPAEDLCKLEDIVASDKHIRIDEEVRASGFSKDDDDILMRFIHSVEKVDEEDNIGEDGENDDSDEDENEEDEEEDVEDSWKKKKSNRKSVSKVTDFLKSSSKPKDDSIIRLEKALDSISVSPYGAEDENRSERDPSNDRLIKDMKSSIDENENGENGLNRISRTDNKNEWIPEAKDLELLDAQDVFSDSEGEGREGTVTMLTEETLQAVKDKTRKLVLHNIISYDIIQYRTISCHIKSYHSNCNVMSYRTT